MTEKDPNGRELNSPGAKADSGKVLPWLMISGFSRALEEVAKVTTVGARKYTKNGWVDVPDGKARYMEAFARHLLALGKGETHDNGVNGTGCLHKAQMIWNLLASLELELREEVAPVANPVVIPTIHWYNPTSADNWVDILDEPN